MICYLFKEPQYLFFAPDLPDLLYYSHLPTMAGALLIGIFVFLNNKKSLQNKLLFAITTLFSLWVLASLLGWTNIHSEFLAFIWPSFGILSALISVFSVYFIYVFTTKKNLSVFYRSVLLVLLSPLFLLGSTNFNIKGFDLVKCDAFMFEQPLFKYYYTAINLLSIIWILFFLIKNYKRVEPSFKKPFLLMGIGIECFLILFNTLTFIAVQLVKIGFFSDSRLEFFGLFGMLIFMIFIAFLIVKFKTFNIKIATPVVLVIGLVFLVSTQYTYAITITSLILTSLTLSLTCILGIILIKSVRKEIKSREKMELLAKDLASANSQLENLVHFVSHEVKGALGKTRNVFSMILEGDYGSISPEMKDFVKNADTDTMNAVDMVMNILKSSDLKSGKLQLNLKEIDLNKTTENIFKTFEEDAKIKGLTISFKPFNEPVKIMADEDLLGVHVIRNLIDNSIKYTQKGEIKIKIEKEGGVARFVLEDTGIGLTDDDKAHLFTEGGKGKDSSKVNIHSSGYGLFFAKGLIESHGGKIWAESEGRDKGSRFIFELKLKN